VTPDFVHPRKYSLNDEPRARMASDIASGRTFGDLVPGTAEYEVAWTWEEIAQLLALRHLEHDIHAREQEGTTLPLSWKPPRQRACPECGHPIWPLHLRRESHRLNGLQEEVIAAWWCADCHHLIPYPKGKEPKA